MDEPADRDPVDATTRLLRRARAGDADGLAALVTRLTPLLESQARYRLAGLPGVDPAEAVQEVWLRALPRLTELEARDGRQTPVVVRYLATTLLNLSHEWKRDAIRRARRGAEGGADARSDLDPAQRIVDDAMTGVVTRVVRRERGEAFSVVLDALDPQERELLVLRGIEQHSNRDVAELLGETPNAVSLRFNRLLDRLRSKLRGSALDDLEP